MRQEDWLTVLLCILLPGPAVGGIFSEEPGFRVMLTKKGLDYVFGPVLRDTLTQLRLPDINDETNVKVVGNIEYQLSEMAVREATVPSTALVNEDGLLRIHISGMSLSLHAKWKYKQKSWPKLKDDGKVDLKAKDLSLTLVVTVRNDGSGRLAISSQGCSFDVKTISVKFHGGASWLYNLFTSFVERRIKDELKSQICNKVTEAVNTFGNKLADTMPLNVQVGDGAEVSCALIGDPLLSSSYILTNHNGEFISTEHLQEVPLSPLPLPPPSSVDPTSKMMYMWLTSYPIDTAAYLYKEAGYMTLDLKDDEIPSFLPRTTADYRSIVPQLYEVYPGLDVEYGVSASVPPSLRLSPGQASLVGEMETTLSVLEAGQSHLAFSLTVSVQCGVDLGLDSRHGGQFIAGKISSFTTSIVYVRTEIGEFDSAPFQDLLDTMAKFVAIPNMNRLLDTGLALPSGDGLATANTVLSVEEGYILLGTDIVYSS